MFESGKLILKYLSNSIALKIESFFFVFIKHLSKMNDNFYQGCTFEQDRRNMLPTGFFPRIFKPIIQLITLMN